MTCKLQIAYQTRFLRKPHLNILKSYYIIMDNRFNINKSALHHFSWCDAIVMVILSAGIFASIPVLNSLTPGKVIVYRDNKIIAEYPLDNNTIFDIKGKEGLMKVEISNQSVEVLSSSCSHQICVRHGAIRHAFDQIVCIPNHILITISAKKDNQPDAIAH